MNGVIASTANHAGYFPHMIGHVEDGVVVRVEGGGLLGDLVRELIERTRNVQYPHHPRPGYNYVNEISLGTNPKVFRAREGRFAATEYFPNSGQRLRAGALKWGIGVDSRHAEVESFAEERGLPAEPGWHLYSSFATYEVRLHSGEWRSVVDRGHLAALDDPDIRRAAAMFGEPDEVLREDWFPAIPGINYPGDYMRDYGENPAEWIRMEDEGRLPLTIGVPQPR
jgi:hypothetical protein